MASPKLDLERILTVLDDHEVRYVIIGGVAALLQDVPIPETLDIDITPAGSKENLRRLAAALREMDAKLRAPGLEEGMQIPLDERTFSLVTTMTFTTRYGPLDVSLRPDGTEGYDDLKRGAVRVREFGISIPVASVPDIIRSKEAAGREKDAEHLVVLREWLREHGG